MIKNKKLIERGILCILAVSFFAVYLSLSFSKNIWTDEAFTIDLIQRSVVGIIKGTAIDVHPPLYYLIAKIPMVIFGKSILALKIVCIIPIILLMTVGAFRLYNLFSFKTAALFIVFLGIMPCTTEYALQLRMYSWAIFFVTWMGISAYCYYIDGKYSDIIIASIMGAGAAYTHYFAFIAALWIYGFLFLAIVAFKKNRMKGWIVAVVVSALMYAPWLGVLLQQVGSVSESYWIEPITAKTMGGFLPFLFDNGIPVSSAIWSGLLILALLWYILQIVCRRNRETAVFGIVCILIPVCTTITGVVVSNILRPIFIIRYVIPCIGLIAIALGLAIDNLLSDREKPVKNSMALIGVLFFFVSLAINYKNSYRLEYTWCKTYETLDFFDTHFQEGDKIVYNYDPYDFVYQCYWDESKIMPVEDIDLEEDDNTTYWLLDTVYWPKPSDDELAQYGYAAEYMGNFGIEHNDFKIYRIYKK